MINFQGAVLTFFHSIYLGEIMSKKRLGLVEKMCNKCGNIEKVWPDVCKCYACDQGGVLEVVEAIEEVPENLRQKMRTRRRDHRKNRRIGSNGVRI